MIEKHINIVINITTFRYYLKIIANKNGKKANVKIQKNRKTSKQEDGQNKRLIENTKKGLHSRGGGGGGGGGGSSSSSSGSGDQSKSIVSASSYVNI